MIHDVWLRWAVTTLSALSGAEWLHVMVDRRREWKFVVSYTLHLAMAVAMAVMVWPWGAHVAARGLAILFLLAGVWFVTVTLVWARTAPGRTLRAYHGLMMLAMAWMYGTPHVHSAEHMDMPGMDMGAMPVSSELPPWVRAADWSWFAGFAAASLVWSYLMAAEVRRPAPGRERVLYAAAQAAMAAGMAISFAAMLFQL